MTRTNFRIGLSLKIQRLTTGAIPESSYAKVDTGWLAARLSGPQAQRQQSPESKHYAPLEYAEHRQLVPGHASTCRISTQGAPEPEEHRDRQYPCHQCQQRACWG